MERRTSQRIFNGIRRLRGDERGAVAVMAAVMMTVLLGLIGLGIETASWYWMRRQLQTAADAAAMAGAVEQARGNKAGVVTAATAAAAQNGIDVAASDGVVVNSPPTSGSLAGTANAVEAVVTRQEERLFSRIVMSGPVVIAARAVASPPTTGGDICVLALDPTKDKAFLAKGSTSIKMPDCLIAANSRAAEAISIANSAEVSALSLWTAGGTSKNDAASVKLRKAATTGGWPLPDPYAYTTIPPLGSCVANDLKITHNAALTPGRYCGGITISGSGHVSLAPGEYYLDGGDLKISGHPAIDCPTCTSSTAGVAIVFTSTGSANDIGGLNITGGPTITLRPRSDSAAPFRGILFYQDRRAPEGGSNRMTGSSATALSGALYFPAQELKWTGSNDTTAPDCLQIIARTIEFGGSSALSAKGCNALGARPIASSLAQLRE